jgi:hypothetical protein
MRFWLGVLTALLVVSPATITDVQYETFVQVEYIEPEYVNTPILDSLVDWDEHERQSECLWEYLQSTKLEITLRNVMAAGEWADVNGGACLLIGEDHDNSLAQVHTEDAS